MNKAAVFVVIILALGAFLWMQKDEIIVQQSGTAAQPAQSARGDAQFIIRQKVKPGGYIGWHQTDRDPLSGSAVQTRQSSNYYFICTLQGSTTETIFLVPESDFTMERVGNVLTSSQVRRFREVTEIQEPDLPPSFEFRRREASY